MTAGFVGGWMEALWILGRIEACGETYFIMLRDFVCWLTIGIGLSESLEGRGTEDRGDERKRSTWENSLFLNSINV